MQSQAKESNTQPESVITIPITGKVHYKLIDENGNVKQEGEGNNLVTDVGEIEIAKAFKGDAVTLPTHMAIGSSYTAAAANQTALGGELGRVALTSTTRTNNAIAYAATFPAGTGTGTVEEAGIFNAGSSGNMTARFLTSTIVKGASDSLQITWTLTIGA